MSVSSESVNQTHRMITSWASVLPILGGVACDTVLRKRSAPLYACGFFILGSVVLAVCGLTHSPSMLYPGFSLFLLGGCIFTPAFYARLTDLYPIEERTNLDGGFLFLTIATTLGGFLAPLFVGTMNRFVGIASTAACLGLLMVIPAYLLQEEVGGKENHSTKIRESTVQLFLLLFSAAIPLSVVMRFSKNFRSILLLAAVTPGSKIEPPVEPISSVVAITGIGIIAAIVLPWFWRNAGRRGKAIKLSTKILVGLIAATFGTLLLPMVQHSTKAGGPATGSVLTLVSLMAVADAFTWPVFMSMVARLAPSNWRATFFGAWETLLYVAIMGFFSAFPYIAAAAATSTRAFGVDQLPVAYIAVSLLSLVLFLKLRKKIFNGIDFRT
jgi:dipeptide/tripeptide permease